MATEANDMNENATSPTKVVDEQKTSDEVADDKNKTPRHPRWTRQETLILIEGKKVVENRGRKGRRSSSVFGSDQLEPKWDSISSYCKQHGVNRGPVQCRKRWSNLLGDFKKIKTWDSQVKEEDGSFWVMRNDLRREKKLPGFFDREVYDVLDGRAFTAAAYQLALVTISADAKDGDGLESMVAEDEDEDEEEEDEAEVVFDSGRQAILEDGLFSDFEQLAHEEKGRVSTDNPTKTIPAPVPISERQYRPLHQVYSDQGKTTEKQSNSHFWKGSMSQEGCKRRRLSINRCQDSNLEDRLTTVLEKSTNMLNAQLEAQNNNCQLDRDQQKGHNDSLVAALNKITDALVRIANKL